MVCLPLCAALGVSNDNTGLTLVGSLSHCPPWEQHGQYVLPHARLQLGLTRQGGFQVPSKAHDVDTGC